MRIQISSSGECTISTLNNSLSGFQKNIKSTIKKLEKRVDDADDLKLTSVSNDLKQRVRIEKRKYNSVVSTKNQIDKFVKNTKNTDKAVAKAITKERRKFLKKYSWYRPPAKEAENTLKKIWDSIVESWDKFWKSVGETIVNAFNSVLAFIEEHWLIIGIIGTVVAVVAAVVVAVLTAPVTLTGLLAVIGKALLDVALIMAAEIIIGVVIDTIFTAGVALINGEDVWAAIINEFPEILIRNAKLGFAIGGITAALSKIAMVCSKLNKGLINSVDDVSKVGLDEFNRIDEVEVEFNYSSKYDETEFARQLSDQQKGMNELTVQEYLDNRQKYIEQGRTIDSNTAQQAVREKAFVDKVDELQDAGLSLREAEEQAQKWLDTQAALHNPDQVAGGHASSIGGLGDKGVNSSIGSQWRSRIDSVDEHVQRMIENMSEAERRSTKLNVKLTYKGE